MRAFAVLLALVVLAILASPALAQTQESSPGARPLELQPYVGIAKHSPVGNFLGVTANRNHLFAGLHISARVARDGRFELAWAPDAALIVLSNNPEPRGPVVIRSPVYGIGLSPVGFETRFSIGSHARLYAATAAGFVMFTRPAPEIDTRRFNYTLEFGWGVDWRVGVKWILRVGYKFHHFSNAFSKIHNPGVDGNVWLLGLGRTIGAP